MFDRTKPADEASASSAQGIERHIEGSLRQESNSSVNIQGPEQAGPGLSSVQNRQGYCNCCHMHYSNLEQHVFSSQHRHFTMFSKNRIGTSSLMERFLQDVLQHHPHRYHDDRPTYDDMPFPIFPVIPRDVCLLPEEVEKEVVRSRWETPVTGGESVVKSCSPTLCRSQESMKEISVLETFIQNLKWEQEHILEVSQQTVGICGNGKKHTLIDGAQIANSSHNNQFTVVSSVPHHLPVTPLCHRSPISPVIAKNIKCSATSNLIPSSSCDHLEKNTCHKEGLLNTDPKPVLASVNPKTPFSHQYPTCSQGNSLCITSGHSFFKRDGLRSQDETLVSDFCLRDLVGNSSSLDFGASPQLRCKDIKVSRGDETSVVEIIEEVILKYCHGATPNELSCKDEESNSCLNISSLLDHSSLEGSEISFACEAPICSVAGLSKANIKDIEFLKEVQVNLDNREYGTRLSSVLNGGSVEQVEAAKQDIIVHNDEPVLPALPHVPPSFVGKTWSQIMYEDDMKVEALVRDFREGRFRCHFDSDSSANGTGKKMRKKMQKDEWKSDIVTGNRTETSSVKVRPEINDALSGGSDFVNLFTTDTLCNPQTLKMPKKRTWRLASRCQVVKVSHGTQTSLANYPVVKRKIIRKESDQSDQKANCVWSENERISNMKTRLCALKLPEAYTKIMSPLQPKTVVYVLSCPENKCKDKPIDVPKMRRNHNSTDSKDSVRYRYKQCSFKYYDPLTNRILKTPPKSTIIEKAKKPSHVRQLFRSLSLDASMKKLSDTQKECAPKSFSWPAFYSSSSGAFLSASLKGSAMNSNQRTDGSSVSTERSDFPVLVHSEKFCNHSVISPFSSHPSQMEGDVRLTPFSNRVSKTPLKSIRSEKVERENPKTTWKRKESTNREPGFSKKASGPMSVKHGLVGRASRVTQGKKASRTKKQKKEWIRRNLSSFASKSSVFSIHEHQTRKPTLERHCKKEKLDTKKLKVRRKPKRTFLNSTVISGITEKRQKVTAGSFPKKLELASSKVTSWELSGDNCFPSTVKRPSRRTSSMPVLGGCLVLPGET